MVGEGEAPAEPRDRAALFGRRRWGWFSAASPKSVGVAFATGGVAALRPPAPDDQLVGLARAKRRIPAFGVRTAVDVAESAAVYVPRSLSLLRLPQNL